MSFDQEYVVGFEVWIAIVLVASGLSGWIGYAYARKGAPAQSELDALAAELDEARRKSDSVQSNVNEHFEQSALLFGKLAADYREFLEHFSDSAQSLGLSESRARELIEQGFQPLLTHADAEEQAAEGEDVPLETAAVAEVTVEMPEESLPDSETPLKSADAQEDPATDTLASETAASETAASETAASETTATTTKDSVKTTEADGQAPGEPSTEADQKRASS